MLTLIQEQEVLSNVSFKIILRMSDSFFFLTEHHRNFTSKFLSYTKFDTVEAEIFISIYFIVEFMRAQMT